jgi:hypothetical protein
MIETLGEPGDLFNIDDFNSSSVNAFPFRCLLAYHIQTALNAFSLEHDPHIIG